MTITSAVFIISSSSWPLLWLWSWMSITVWSITTYDNVVDNTLVGMYDWEGLIVGGDGGTPSIGRLLLSLLLSLYTDAAWVSYLLLSLMLLLS